MKGVFNTYLHEKTVCLLNRYHFDRFSERICLSISTSFGIISGNFDIFEQKNDNGLNICYSLAWIEVKFIVGFKMARARVSTMKFKEANHDEPPKCSPLIGTGMSHAFRPSKKNEKYKNYKRKSRVNKKIEKRCCF